MGRGIFFLTGQPGSGKSTVMMKCVEELRSQGFTVGGISTPEIRIEGRRTGFSVIDLASGRRAIMAGADIASGYRVGRYGVDVGTFESLALPALEYADRSCDVICVDEIGRMELYSKPFKQKIEELIHGRKPMIAVLHRGYVEVYGGDGTVFNVYPDNRDRLPGITVSLLKDFLKHDI